LAICALYAPSSLSSFLILTSIPPMRVSVDAMASVSDGFGRALLVPKIWGQLRTMRFQLQAKRAIDDQP
jgi:hypothetical protein